MIRSTAATGAAAFAGRMATPVISASATTATPERNWSPIASRHPQRRSAVDQLVKEKEHLMRRLLTLVSVLALVVLGTGLVSGRVAAQEEPMATPGEGEARVVSPEECQIAPRPEEEVFALLGM